MFKIATFQGLLFSPNLIWLAVTVANYFAFPYDFDRAAVLDRGWVVERILVNTFIVGSCVTTSPPPFTTSGCNAAAPSCLCAPL